MRMTIYEAVGLEARWKVCGLRLQIVVLRIETIRGPGLRLIKPQRFLPRIDDRQQWTQIPQLRDRWTHARGAKGAKEG